MPDNDAVRALQRIGIVGAGNMGTSMALGFSELGLDVSVWDVNPRNVDEALEMAAANKSERGKIEGFHEIHPFAQSLDAAPRKVFVFSITHGFAADSVLEKLDAQLKEGDIILDGGNEHYRNTERRQEQLAKKGVKWIGMGVSGGYQSARQGPSMSPGGDEEAVTTVLPMLKAFAAKDVKSGKPCVDYIGPRGAGHYIKMVHNGIENGMLSTLCEAWGILHHSLGLENDRIGKIFEQWNTEGELRNTFLVQIGSEICQRKKTPKGDGRGEGTRDGGYVLDDILDKIVQDDDSTEGTLYWTVAEAALRHISAPTIATGHFMRVASGDRDQRIRVSDQLRMPNPSRMQVEDEPQFVEMLRKAVFCAFLCSFCQGLELIARASRDESWNIKLATCIRIWRAGCIIQEEYIADLLEPIFASSRDEITNMKLIEEVSSHLRDNYNDLKSMVLRATETDQYVPSLSASLEYMKYCGGKMLPTKFMNAQMDFFGAHSFDRVGVEGEDPGRVKKGAHHYEWRPA